MKECWSEGALRAYLDRELPPEDMERVATHLEICSECGDLWSELAGRAGRVSALMGALPDPDRTVSTRRAPQRAKVATWRWAGAAVALAAGLLVGIVLLPKHPAPQMTVVVPTVAPGTKNMAPTTADPIEAPVPRIMNAMAKPVRPRSIRQSGTRVSPKAQSDDGFVALDDEPLDVGVVLRVALGPKEIPADVIFGSDGRPHAIRLVNDKSKH